MIKFRGLVLLAAMLVVTFYTGTSLLGSEKEVSASSGLGAEGDHDCSVFYKVTYSVNQEEYEGYLEMRYFSNQNVLAIAFRQSGIEFPPALIYLTNHHTYDSLYMPPHTSTELRNGLVQAFTQMQWSSDHQVSHEKDSNGYYKVTYSSNGHTKTRQGYERKNDSKLGRISFSGTTQRRMTAADRSLCSVSEVTGHDNYTVTANEQQPNQHLVLKYHYQKQNPDPRLLVDWLSWDYPEIKQYIDNYQIALSDMPKEPVELSWEEFRQQASVLSTQQRRHAIMAALGNQAFLNDFIASLLDGDVIEYAQDIIMYMSHKDTLQTQTAILTLLQLAEQLPEDLALQAAITAGEFSNIKDEAYSAVLLESFERESLYDPIRSAAISSLGRMSAKTMAESPTRAATINRQLSLKLQGKPLDSGDTAYLLDALSNSRSDDAIIFSESERFLESDFLPVFQRAADVAVSSGNGSYLENKLRQTQNVEKQSVMLLALADGHQEKSEELAYSYLLSGSDGVRHAALSYLLSKKEAINQTTVERLAALDGYETNHDNRVLLIKVLARQSK